ncbi:FlxA-like family protein [Achromobacter sp.]|uniref:FlxA-like family protein n=1 Tax=Achromobacter sp. TaxID=134375 RepID=UPI003C7718A4
MAINPINGISRATTLADMWAEKIQANKEAKNASGEEAGTVSTDGKIRVNNPGGLKVGGAQAAKETEDSSNDDAYTRQIKELQKQLKRVMDQIAKVKASGMPAEMKAQQMMALNAQAMQIQQQITAVMDKQARAMQGGVSATA